MIPYNKKLVSYARELRKNMTPEEKHLWYDFLKRLPYNVRRQPMAATFSHWRRLGITRFYDCKNKVPARLF